MTHDELLAKIDGQIRSNPMGVFFPYLLAVRAVVELHKLSDGQCYECHYEGRDYPCHTIQAIEQVLS